MRRGAPSEALPEGVRQDTRKHTRHVLRPEADAVAEYLAAPSEDAWRRFAARYAETVEARFERDRRPFDELAALATRTTVHLGCSCPTRRVPDVRRCHTWLALEFMRARYPELEVRFPDIRDAGSS